jgi:phosphatidylglycerophosphate synthase
MCTISPRSKIIKKYLTIQWLSPNMVTILGLVAQMLGIVLITFYDYKMKDPLPAWTYIIFVILMFIGQTLDAIDGKHARNTKRSSPLGQLMDHGCDAISNSFIVIMIAQAHTFGGTIYTVLIQVLVQLSFYILTLEEHYTGTLRTHIENLGVTEFQFIGMGIILIPVIFGHSFSKIRFFEGLVSIGEILVYLNAIL